MADLGGHDDVEREGVEYGALVPLGWPNRDIEARIRLEDAEVMGRGELGVLVWGDVMGQK